MPPEFDMQAAQEQCRGMRSASEKEYHATYDAYAKGAGEMLPAALDEIERKNAYIEQLSKQCQAFLQDEEIEGWIRDHHYLENIHACQLADVAKKWHAAYRKAQNSNLVRKQQNEQQAKRIADLDSENAMHRTTIEAFKAQIVASSERIADLEGAAKADESRLAEAAKKAGIGYFGCDTPDHLADRVLELGDALAEIARLRGLPREGLFGKYVIRKADGSPVDPKADYFVLRLDTDEDARVAALEYAVRTMDQKLSNELVGRCLRYPSGQTFREQQFKRLQKQRAALKKLGQAKRERGKALVEERAKTTGGILCEYADDELFCAEREQWCDWESCTINNKARQKIREQLRAEGLL